MLTAELLPQAETKKKITTPWSIPGHKDDLSIFSHVSLERIRTTSVSDLGGDWRCARVPGQPPVAQGDGGDLLETRPSCPGHGRCAAQEHRLTA